MYSMYVQYVLYVCMYVFLYVFMYAQILCTFQLRGHFELYETVCMYAFIYVIMYVCMYVCVSTLMVNKAKAAIVQEAKKKEDLKQYHKNYQDRVYQVHSYA